MHGDSTWGAGWDDAGMSEKPEEGLDGGNASGEVTLAEGTVRKAWTPATPHVIAYMATVREAGVDVPAHRGRDEQGRQVLEYVPGGLGLGAAEAVRPRLPEIGALVREIHEASLRHRPAADAVWEAAIPPPPDAPGEALISHGDLTPWNLVLGERLVFIDWDAAGPTTRGWDLAYSAQAFTLNDTARDPRDAAADLARFLDGYGADPALRDALPELLPRRAGAMLQLLEDSHRRGIEPWASMYPAGHGDHWRGITQYLARHREVIGRGIDEQREPSGKTSA